MQTKQSEALRILHTADWHIGQSFFEYDRKAEHLVFFDWLKKQIQQQSVDVLLIAGDVFDSPNPSAESQKMYYRFLREVTTENPGLQIVAIAGNHDSAGRLEAPNPLLEEMNISVKGIVKRTPEGEIDYENLLIPLTKNGETVAWCLVVPYLRQGDYPPAESYAAGVGLMYDSLYDKVKNRGLPIVAMGHLQATGAELSDNDRSERTVIGGLECVSPDSFAKDVAYTALGHLHKPQRVSGREHVRYSGAPLPMSFAEKNYKQGVDLITIDKQLKSIERLAFDSPVKLLSIPKQAQPLEDVLLCIAELPNGEPTYTSPFLEIKVLITEPEPSLRHQIEEALKDKAIRLARISSVTATGKTQSNTITYEQLQTINPMEMAVDIFKQKYGGDDMPEHLKGLLQSIIQDIDR